MEGTKALCSRRSIFNEIQYLSQVIAGGDDGIDSVERSPYPYDIDNHIHNVDDYPGQNHDTSSMLSEDSGSVFLKLNDSLSIPQNHDSEHIGRFLGGKREVESSILPADHIVLEEKEKITSNESATHGADSGLDYPDMPMKSAKDMGIKLRTSEKRATAYTFSCFDFFISICAIVLYFIDIGTDIKLAADYFMASQWFHASITTALIVGPSLVTCFFGLHWYHIDYKSEQKVIAENEKHGSNHLILKTPSYVWFLRIIFTLFQFGPVVRTVEYIYYGFKSISNTLDEKQRKRYHWWMLYEEVDNCLLRLFECFLESAPQLAWQLYIVIGTKPNDSPLDTTTRTLALLSSWASLSASMVSYQRSLRNSREDKKKMSLLSIPFYFLWRASETGGRVLCLAMFALACNFWVFFIIALHWIVISCWLMCQRTTFYSNRCLERVFNIICGYVMTFCFLNLREGHTRYRFIIYYMIFYIENFSMLSYWMAVTPEIGGWFHMWGFIAVVALFVLHILFQLLYYAYFHPTRNIKCCLPCSKQTFCQSVCHDKGPVLDDDTGSQRRRLSSRESAYRQDSEIALKLLQPVNAVGNVQKYDDIEITVNGPKENGHDQKNVNEVQIYKKRRSSGLQKVKRPRNSDRLQSW